jgi:hypothetical protein
MSAFPKFEILTQYEPKDSIELKDRNKFPLLVLENYFLPFFLDWVCLNHSERSDDLFSSKSSSFIGN